MMPLRLARKTGLTQRILGIEGALGARGHDYDVSMRFGVLVFEPSQLPGICARRESDCELSELSRVVRRLRVRRLFPSPRSASSRRIFGPAP